MSGSASRELGVRQLALRKIHNATTSVMTNIKYFVKNVFKDFPLDFDTDVPVWNQTYIYQMNKYIVFSNYKLMSSL